MHCMDTGAEPLAHAIGARVKQQRMTRRWTLDQLASYAGVSRRVLVNVEQGAVNPRVGTLLRLSDALGVGLWDYEAAEFCDLVELVGDVGTLWLSAFSTEPLRLTTAAGTTAIDAPYPPVVQEPLIANVVASLRGEAAPLSTGESALRTARVIDTILADHRRTHQITF